MLNRDKPLGQRRGDGYVFGVPLPLWWDAAPARANATHSVTRKRKALGWTDRVGMPHGRSGDKLARKIATASVGISRRGPLGYMLYAKSTSGRHQR